MSIQIDIRLLAVLFLSLFWLSACSNRWAAPIEDRNSDQSTLKIAPKERALRPESYIVSSGESLYSIGFKYGLDYQQIANWNNIKAPYRIYPGQKLHLKAGQVVSTKPLPRKPPVVKPSTKTPGKKPTKAPAKPTKPALVKKETTDSNTTSPPQRQAAASKRFDSSRKVRWQWPTNGEVIKTYLANDPARKGIDIAGRDGQSIRAAASGVVVYSGNGLLGYGELIIIKHSEKYLSAYAYNRKRLVTEGTTVQAGQKIAEMGQGVDGRVKLHFEIRVNGKPGNPQQYLPRR